MKRKIVSVASIFLLILSLLTICNNLLMLDDFHPLFSTLTTEEANETNIENMKGYFIFINLDALILSLYKDGSLIRTYPVSGGKANTPSPTGTWKIVDKSTWGEGFGGSWLGLNVPWGKYGIHGTKSPWYVGKSNASHGCIRMNNKDAKEIFEMVPHGTTVAIAQKNISYRILKSGDVGSDVLMVQKALKKLGYFHDWASGKYGDNLKRSVIKYQKANNLKVTGTINKALYDKIIHQYKDKIDKEQI